MAERWVRDGNVITTAGVSAGIDMALHLVRELADQDTARKIQLFVEYDPEPPFGSIDWEDVGPAQYAPRLRQRLRQGLTDHPGLLARLTG